ncbi:CoA transferase subunit A [Halorussus sp. AFM4]|uniref:CoA transferase subunit A n=1 Tax=Halorussus sp. AFM4 TaxID=3421651 RepID=UPI003EC0329B
MTGVADLVSRVDDGATIALAGKTLHRAPMAFVRELVRQDVSDVTLMGLANSMDVDLPTGTGHATAVHYGYVGFEGLGLAPNFRQCVEDGAVDAREGTCYTVATMFRGAVQGVPFLPVAGLTGSDLLEVNDAFHSVDDPFTGEAITAVRAVEPDIAVVHTTEADSDGNARFDGADLTENLVAKAADRTFVTTEQIVETKAFADTPSETDIPGFLVDGVAEVPYGAHPTSCPGTYDYDAAHLRTYLERSREGDLEDYLAEYLGDDEQRYRERAVPAAETIEWSSDPAATLEVDL